MKEIIPRIFKLETETERMDFLNNIWVTDLFKDFFKGSNPMVQTIKNSFTKYPRYFYEMQNKDLERAAFTSWYNVLSKKTYANPYIQDLYYFHEIIHISTMPYMPELDFKSWSTKMRNNEVLASMNSEVLVYFYIPEYRQHTFKEEIWVDRFLKNPYYLDLAKNNLTQLVIELTAKRAEAYDHPKDEIEHILSDFRTFSHLFYRVWENKYSELEANVNKVFKGKVEEYEQYLRDNQGPSGILFESQVEKHQENYEIRNKRRPHY